MTVAAAAAASLLRLAIYYGYPSLVEQSGGDVARAVRAFEPYDVIVFGDGLEQPPDGKDPGLDAERRRLGAIISGLHASSSTRRLYGYIDLGRTQNLAHPEIERRIDAWRQRGVDGIFFDEAGADFEVTPARLAAAVGATHERGLSVFLNAFNPDDLFVADDGTPASRRRIDQIGPGDLLLVESFAVRLGVREAPERTAARAAAATRWRDRTGVRVFGITTAGVQPATQELIDHAWRAAVAAGLDGMGWGEPNFSADSRLPRRTPAP